MNDTGKCCKTPCCWKDGSLRFLFCLYKNGVKVRKLVALVVKWRNNLKEFGLPLAVRIVVPQDIPIKHCFFVYNYSLSSIDYQGNGRKQDYGLGLEKSYRTRDANVTVTIDSIVFSNCWLTTLLYIDRFYTLLNSDETGRKLCHFEQDHQYSTNQFFQGTQCGKIREKLPLFVLCERSELVTFSQLFCSFSQIRHLTVELSQPKPKIDWKTSKMTRQFCRDK